MSRWGRLSFAVVAAVAFAGDARAQWGYGYYPGAYGGYGWGGWGGAGSTVQGSIASGLGFYAMGAGQYNLDTAQARSINADTALRWNEYWYEAQVNANRHERARLARRQAIDSSASAANEKRIRENPSPADIESGNALNAILDQITDPRIHSSALRLATTKVPGKVVREIPFFVATEAATINLDELTGEKGWPTALRDERFDEERKAFSADVDKALEEDREGDLTPQTIKRLRDSLGRLRAKFSENRPKDPAEAAEAENHLKALYGMARMLEKPDIEKVLAELDTIKETTIGSLLGFMHTFNLRFGRAQTPSQRAAYQAIYPALDSLRDQVVTDTGLDTKTAKSSRTPNPPRPTSFLNALTLDHLEGPHRIIEKPAK